MATSSTGAGEVYGTNLAAEYYHHFVYVTGEGALTIDDQAVEAVEAVEHPQADLSRDHLSGEDKAR